MSDKDLPDLGFTLGGIDELRDGEVLVGAAVDAADTEPVYGFRSLLRFKRKFSPSLEPMHLVVPDPVALPAIGLAIARCCLPILTVAQASRVIGSRR